MISEKHNTNILHVLVGLPCSGKTKYAQNTGYPVVSLNSVREAIHGPGPHNTFSDELIMIHAVIMIRSLFLAGHKNVVYDACNLTIADRNKLRSKVWVRSFNVINVDTGVSIQNCIKQNNSHMVDVINYNATCYQPIATDEYTIRESNYSSRIKGSKYDN